ncbi:MAG: mechanosensitive ion channel [Alphaproteobacteria bacterium]|nr:mechanosensitive ion channel [Alphaproteobacteria bacterium]MCB9695544.1 mechanosensitive ion channel [Alphaproteobacteria bacterium]
MIGVGPFGMLRVVLVGLALAGALSLLRWAIDTAPMSSGRRQALRQGAPLMGVLLGVLYLAWVVQQLFTEEAPFAAAGVLGVLFGGLWLARHVLHDGLTGAVLRAGGTLARGDQVRIDGVTGRVRWLGARVLALQTPSGDEVLVPYSRLSRDAVTRTPRTDGAARHVFVLPRSPDGTLPDPERIRRTALLCHWCSAGRAPVVEAAADGLRVTVFLIEADRGPMVEETVRRASQPSSAPTIA